MSSCTVCVICRKRMSSAFRSPSSGNESDAKYSHLTGSALYSTTTDDIDSQYNGSVHVYEYDESNAGHSDEKGPIEDIDLYPVFRLSVS